MKKPLTRFYVSTNSTSPRLSLDAVGYTDQDLALKMARIWARDNRKTYHVFVVEHIAVFESGENNDTETFFTRG